MIRITDEFQVKHLGTCYQIYRKAFKKYVGKKGTSNYKELETPKEYMKPLEKFPSNILNATKIIKRILIGEMADKEKVYEISEIEEYLKNKGL